jgi:hypothetical protein
MFKFDNFLSPEKIERSNTILRPKLEELVVSKLDEAVGSLNDVKSKRNLVIESLDKLNYLTKYVGDGQIKDQTYTQATLSGFTFSTLYDEYDIFVDFFDKNSDKFIKDLDTTINFDSLSVNVTILSDLLSVLLSEENDLTSITDIYKDDILFSDNIKKRIERKVKRFIKTTKPEKINLSRFKKLKGDSELKFTVSSTADITDGTQKEMLEKIHLDQVTTLGSTLNNFKPTKVEK